MLFYHERSESLASLRSLRLGAKLYLMLSAAKQRETAFPLSEAKLYFWPQFGTDGDHSLPY